MSAMVAAIYDCAVNPSAWPEVLTALRSTFNVASIQLVTTALSGQCSRTTTVGVDTSWQARLPEYGGNCIHLWGGPQLIRQYRLDLPVAHSHVSERRVMNNEPFYREWAHPQGFGDYVGVVLGSEPGQIHALMLGRGKGQGDLRHSEAEKMSFLAPHIGRAARIGDVVSAARKAAQSAQDTLEVLSLPVLMVDADMRLVHANNAAADLLRKNVGLAAKNGLIAASDPRTQNALAIAVGVATQDETLLQRRDMEIPLFSADGEARILHVLPLARGDARREVSSYAVAALFIAERAQDTRLPAAAIAVIYHLTPAETRVFKLIVDGYSLPAIARQLEVAVSTVRTHILRLLEKTGSSRQSDLVRLAGSLSLPILSRFSAEIPPVA
jgi:DNA-binding CsgD family transcriptional regulator/PAS domain-containing protein